MSAHTDSVLSPVDWLSTARVLVSQRLTCPGMSKNSNPGSPQAQALVWLTLVPQCLARPSLQQPWTKLHEWYTGMSNRSEHIQQSYPVSIHTPLFWPYLVILRLSVFRNLWVEEFLICTLIGKKESSDSEGGQALFLGLRTDTSLKIISNPLVLRVVSITSQR